MLSSKYRDVGHQVGSGSSIIETIPRKIHQIFMDIGKGNLYQAAKGRFYQSHKLTSKLCKRAYITYHLWGKTEIEALISGVANGRYLDFYKKLREDIQRIDFAKYVILYKYGGIYMDLDVNIIEDDNRALRNLMRLFKLEYLFVRWNDSTLPYNAILGASRKHPLFLAIIKGTKQAYIEKSKMPIYKKWKGRFVFQTTGHYMLQRVLKQHNIDDYITDPNNFNTV